MTCYIVPSAAALIHYSMRRKIPSLKNNTHQKWLNLLLIGGAIFGIVDHLWNGEIFLIGENVVMDLMLGVTITLVILGAWGIMVAVDKAAVKETAKT